jgi:hypothetical protein
MGVTVGVGVGVSVGVAVGVGVRVFVAVGVRVRVAVGVGVSVGDDVAVRVGVGEGVTVWQPEINKANNIRAMRFVIRLILHNTKENQGATDGPDVISTYRVTSLPTIGFGEIEAITSRPKPGLELPHEVDKTSIEQIIKCSNVIC